MKGVFIPEITKEMLRNGCLESVETLMAEGEIHDVDIPCINVKRRTGRWVQISPAKIYECSECGQNVMTDDICAYRFCHGCGAKMEERKKEQKTSIWIRYSPDRVTCKRCQTSFRVSDESNLGKYCPACGAEMGGNA